jgi:hypothetical protein
VSEPLPRLPTAGVVTTREWAMTASGRLGRFYFSREWRVVTDVEISSAIGERFHSSEKWSLLAICGEQIVAWIPGCQVLSFVACEEKPQSLDQIVVELPS